MLLEIRNLKIKFKNNKNYIIDDINLDVEKGEIISLVGESGSGKSLTSLAMMKLISTNAQIEGKIKFEGRNLLDLNEKYMCDIRGKEISMIFQEPMIALNPLFNIEYQIGEVIKEHTNLKKGKIRNIIIDLLEKVRIKNPNDILKKYPHELSGGMRQRIMIAMAIALTPKLLIADEPTTGLDVTVQKEILKLIKDISKEYNMSVIFITHDLDVVAEIADKVYIMYLGKVVEEADVYEFFDNPKHPYSKGLLMSRLGEKLVNNRFYSIKGNIPTIDKIPNGCSFNNRCERCNEKCLNDRPKLMELKKNHKVSCFNIDLR